MGFKIYTTGPIWSRVMNSRNLSLNPAKWLILVCLFFFFFWYEYSMKKLIIVLTLVAISGCKNDRVEVSKDCQDMKSAFNKAAQGYYVNCMRSCFKVSGEYLKELKIKEKLRDSCDLACRDAIPYPELNKFKSYLDDKYSCGFDYGSPLGNPLKNKEDK